MLLEKDLKLHYPRPQFVRDNWLNLNGEWEFEFDDKNIGEIERWFEKKAFSKKIEVPFCYQSENSGIEDSIKHEIVWYKRSFICSKLEGERTIIHFEAADYETKLWVNGQYVGSHRGGHVPFQFEITNEILAGENEIVVRVEDRNSCEQPIGKQSWKEDNFLCWYTRTTGIWQSVWIETVNDFFIEDIKMNPNIDTSKIEIDAYLDGEVKRGYLEAEIYFKGEFIRKSGVSVINNRARLSIDVSAETPDFRVEYWTPDTPNLYDITFTLSAQDEVKDIVKSYFGMRKTSMKGPKILLNNKEFYQKLILDQGYYENGLMTPKSVENIKSDLCKVKEMGFNGVRKHQKIADNRYMYLCDTLGLVMWAEMPSAFEFNDRAMENTIQEMKGLIKKHYNHPSVIVYTLLNESWGINEVYDNKEQQNFVNALYYMVKAMDSSRLIVGNDGWEHTITDILTIHDYNSDSEAMRECYANMEKAVNGSPSLTSKKENYCEGYHYKGGPVMISEYGGVAFTNNDEKDAWGYGTRPKSEEEVLERIKDLTQAVMDIDYVCGFCYTQLTDVEQEINGLLDHQHNYKFDPKKVKEILGYKHNGGYLFE